LLERSAPTHISRFRRKKYGHNFLNPVQESQVLVVLGPEDSPTEPLSGASQLIVRRGKLSKKRNDSHTIFLVDPVRGHVFRDPLQ
jgi:hypothetical protein